MSICLFTTKLIQLLNVIVSPDMDKSNAFHWLTPYELDQGRGIRLTLTAVCWLATILPSNKQTKKRAVSSVG